MDPDAKMFQLRPKRQTLSQKSVKLRQEWYDDLANRNIRVTPERREEVLAEIHEHDSWYMMKSLKNWVYGQPRRRLLGKAVKQKALVDAHIAENSAATTMNFVLEAMRISNAFLLNLPSEGSDVALDGVAAVCQMDVASLKKYHALLHTQNSSPESDRFEPLPPLIIPQASGSHEPQTPSTTVTSPSPLTPPPSISSPFKDTSSSTSNIKKEATQETVVIVDLPSPNVIPHHSSDRIPSPPHAEQVDYLSLEFDDLEYPSSEADSEDFEPEETPMTSVPNPTTFSQLLERFEDKESILDRILTLMDYGKDKPNLVKMDLS